MLCPNCNQEFTTKFCPNCGYTPTNQAQGTTPDITPRPKKKSGCLVALLVVVAGFFVLMVLIGMLAGDPADSSASVSASSGPAGSASSKPAPAASVPFETELTNGHYISGVDFPSGKYDIIAVSGGGNVSSSNMFDGGINAVMGIAKANDIGASLYEAEYKNIRLPEGVTLSVSGVVVKLTSENASADPLSPRSQTITEPVELGNGNFIAGEDFPAGTYDLTALSGGGNVSSSNMFENGINAIMGVSDDPTLGGLYDKSYRNVELPEGTELKINGVKLSLTPSK